MAFVLLAASVLCQVTAQNLIRGIQARSRNVYVSTVSNYLTAAVLAALYCAWTGAPASWWRPAVAGLLTGTLYTGGLLCFFRSMDQRGLTISSAVSSTATLIPVLLAILLFKEPLNALRTVGIAVAIAAMPLLSLATASGKAIRQRPSVPFALVFFLVQGGAMSGNLIAFNWLDAASLPFYFVVLFTWATLLGLVLWQVWHKERGKGDIRRGAAFGLFNFLSTITILTALGYLDSYVFFATSSVLILTLNLGVAAWLWHERVAAIGWAGLALAVVATALLHLK